MPLTRGVFFHHSIENEFHFLQSRDQYGIHAQGCEFPDGIHRSAECKPGYDFHHDLPGDPGTGARNHLSRPVRMENGAGGSVEEGIEKFNLVHLGQFTKT